MRHARLAGLLMVFALGSPSASAQEKIAGAGGDIIIRPLAHASVQVEFGGRVIQVDPWSRANLASARPADLILVTDADAGAHHLDATAIDRVRKAGTAIVIPQSGKAKVPDGIVLANGERREAGGFAVEAIAAYDLTPGEPFHAKGVANGYVVTVGGKRLYFAGVTECVPEIRALQRIDVVFVPMNLPQGRMTPAAVADCLRSIKAPIAYPYHFDQGYIGRISGRGGQAQQAVSPADSVRALAAAVKADGIDVRLGDWYPLPPGF